MDGTTLKDSYYMYLDSSSFKKSYYSNNSPWDFTSKLLEPIFLNSTSYEVAITEITWIPKDIIIDEDTPEFGYIPPNNQNNPPPLPNYEMYVLSDIIGSEIQVGNKVLPLLRIVKEPTVFQHLYYMPVSPYYIDRIRIYIRKYDNSYPDLEIEAVRCTLHIRKKEST